MWGRGRGEDRGMCWIRMNQGREIHCQAYLFMFIGEASLKQEVGEFHLIQHMAQLLRLDAGLLLSASVFI